MRHLATASAALALALACAAPALAQAPRQIGLGETLRGELTNGDAKAEDGSFYDVYQFQAIAGQSFVIDLKSDDFDPYLKVTGPGGLDVSNDDGVDGSLDAHLDFTVPQTGMIEIQANSYEEGEAGRYSIVLQAGAAARQIGFGETMHGELGPESPLHSDGTPYQPFVFQGRKDQTITVDMASPDFDAYLVLRKVGQADDLASNDDGAGGTDAELVFSLPDDGSYEIRANALEEDSDGSFTLTLKDGVETREAPVQPIVYGRIIRGELTGQAGRDDEGLLYDAYSFEGQRGDKITITATSSDFDPMLFLAGPGDEDDDWLADNDDADDEGTDAEIVVTLPRNGTYTIHMVSYEVGTMGHYLLGLSR